MDPAKGAGQFSIENWSMPKKTKRRRVRKENSSIKASVLMHGSRLLSFFGSLLFLTGIALELGISTVVADGEIEARVYSTQYNYADLPMQCPLMLAAVESGTVTATITNPIEENVSPVVTADISRAGGDRQFTQTLSLAPHETQTVQWAVDASDIIYGRLILVNITQSRYGDSPTSEIPARQGTCGISILGLAGLSGSNTFKLLFSASLICILAGAGLWLHANPNLDERGQSLAHASTALAVLGTIGLLTTLLRWWGLIIFSDSVALILIVVILTELVLLPRPRNV